MAKSPKRPARRKCRWPLQVNKEWSSATIKEVKRIAKENEIALKKALHKRNEQ